MPNNCNLHFIILHILKSNKFDTWHSIVTCVHVNIDKKEFEYTKEVIGSCKSQDRQYNGQKKREKNDKKLSTK